jgi:hypothetical protein
MAFFAEVKKILKFIWNHHKRLNSQNNLKNKAGVVTVVKPSYKAIVIKTVWYWHEERQKDQQHRIEIPEINLSI